MPILGAKSHAARGCASKLACGRRIDPHGAHSISRNVAANLPLPNGRTGSSAPTEPFSVLRWFVQFCDCILPGGVEPLPYAAGGNFTDSHWCGPICRCVPHNPFVTASPCHLPLHKGGFGAAQTQQHLKTYHPSPHQSAVQKAPPGGRGFFYCSVCRASSMRVMSTSAV